MVFGGYVVFGLSRKRKVFWFALGERWRPEHEKGVPLSGRSAYSAGPKQTMDLHRVLDSCPADGFPYLRGLHRAEMDGG